MWNTTSYHHNIIYNMDTWYDRNGSELSQACAHATCLPILSHCLLFIVIKLFLLCATLRHVSTEGSDRRIVRSYLIIYICMMIDEQYSQCRQQWRPLMCVSRGKALLLIIRHDGRRRIDYTRSSPSLSRLTTKCSSLS